MPRFREKGDQHDAQQPVVVGAQNTKSLTHGCRLSTAAWPKSRQLPSLDGRRLSTGGLRWRADAQTAVTATTFRRGGSRRATEARLVPGRTRAPQRAKPRLHG